MAEAILGFAGPQDTERCGGCEFVFDTLIAYFPTSKK
jgi:hypothetical protein